MLLSLFFYPYQNDSIKTALYSIELSKEDSLIENDKFGKVTLTTCHSSKGLEWKKVYILEVNSNNWPSAIASRTIERTINSFNISEEIIDEERRLLYVAITRAKDEVCLVSSVIDSRTLNFNEPSFFLSNEIRGSFSNIMEFVRENKKSKGLDL